MTFIDMLLNRDHFQPPHIGTGRIHTIDDAEDEIPDQIHRQLEIMKAIEAGEGNADAIRRRLAFPVPKPMLIADCEDLAERGLVAIKRDGKHTFYCPANKVC